MSINHTSNSNQAAWVAIGSFFSFLVGIVSPMILSRYFDKADYGTYKQVMYIYHTFLVIFTLGLPKAYAYFLPKFSIEYSKDIINKVTKLFFILGFVFSLFLFFCAGSIASVMNNPDLRIALMIFSPTPFLLLPTMGLDAIYASFRKTKYLAFYTIFTRLLTILCIVLPVVIFSGNYIYAIIGFDVASLITFIIAFYLKSWPIKGVEHKTSVLKYEDILRFSLPLLYASFWGIIISSSNQFFISRYFGNDVFAEFSNGFMEIPFVGMIIGSISAVLLPVFSRMDKGDGMNIESLNVWNSALLKSAKLIFPILIFSVFFAKTIMTCMYGDMYIQSSIYFVIKNLSGLFYIIPFYPIILAIGKTKDYAKVHFHIAITLVVAEYIVCKVFDSAVFVAVTSELCQILKLWLLMRIVASYANKNILELLQSKQLLKIMVISVFASFPPFLIINIVDVNKFIGLLISLSLFLADYYALCFIMGITYRDIANSFIRNNSRLSIITKFIP